MFEAGVDLDFFRKTYDIVNFDNEKYNEVIDSEYIQSGIWEIKEIK